MSHQEWQKIPRGYKTDFKKRKITKSTDMFGVDVKVACTKQYSWSQCFSGNEMPNYSSVGMHNGWPVLAFYLTFTQDQVILRQMQRLPNFILYLTSFCYILKPQAFCLGSERKNIKVLVLVWPPSLTISFVLDCSVSSDCILFWMSTIDRVSCTHPAIINF